MVNHPVCLIMMYVDIMVNHPNMDGFQLVMGVPPARWMVYFMENPIKTNG